MHAPRGRGLSLGLLTQAARVNQSTATAPFNQFNSIKQCAHEVGMNGCASDEGSASTRSSCPPSHLYSPNISVMDLVSIPPPISSSTARQPVVMRTMSRLRCRVCTYVCVLGGGRGGHVCVGCLGGGSYVHVRVHAPLSLQQQGQQQQPGAAAGAAAAFSLCTKLPSHTPTSAASSLALRQLAPGMHFLHTSTILSILASDRPLMLMSTCNSQQVAINLGAAAMRDKAVADLFTRAKHVAPSLQHLPKPPLPAPLAR